jgi:hypothetical protein
VHDDNGLCLESITLECQLRPSVLLPAAGGCTAESGRTVKEKNHCQCLSSCKRPSGNHQEMSCATMLRYESCVKYTPVYGRLVFPYNSIRGHSIISVSDNPRTSGSFRTSRDIGNFCQGGQIHCLRSQSTHLFAVVWPTCPKHLIASHNTQTPTLKQYRRSFFCR